jgi:integrase
MSGHIRRRGERSWELKYDLGVDPITAKRRIRYANVKGTKREAQAKLTELLSAADRGAHVDASKETLAEFLDRWDRDWASSNVGAKTRERWQELAAIQIKPHIGALLIQKVRPVHLTELYATLLRTGSAKGGPLAPKTVGHAHRLLKRALGHATQWGLIAQNPTAAVSPPRVIDKEIEVVSETEIRAVLESLRDRNRPLYTIAMLALATGMRRGELAALRWRDVDLNGIVTVAQSIEQTRAGTRAKAPKTRHGRRTISIPASTVAELRAHRVAQQERRLALGQGRGSPDDMVFTTWQGTPYLPNQLTNTWISATTAVGRKIGLHALRHTHASNLIASGVDILTVSRRLGHAKPTTTLNVYGHLYGNTDDRTAQVVEEMFSRVWG